MLRGRLPEGKTSFMNDQSNVLPIKTPQGAILIIDDNFAIRKVLSDILSLFLEMPIYTAANGHEGLQVFQEQQHITLIFLDVEMPVMNGQQTYEKLQQIAPQVGVIISSSLSQAEARARFGKQELPTFLRKPYDVDTLLNVTRAAFGTAKSYEA